ncbi:MAG: hypothetical protein VKQ33_10985 [Candidatus Sericytochromatia bacterium]|nr:hypothetical protein [Candidatus Sericytochromatia bacterium]
MPPPEPTPIPSPVGPRLQGTVRLQDRPVPGARLRAFDLATGAGVPLSFRPPASPASFITLQVGSRVPTTTSVGRFNFALPTTAPDRVVKLVVTLGGRTWVAFWQRPGTDGEGVTLRLNGATTALARCLEGVLKLGLRLGPDRRERASRRTLARLEALTPALETAFARVPNSEPLAVTLGILPGTEQLALGRALLDAGAAASLTAETRTLLQAVAADLAADTPDARGLFPIEATDFPLGTFSQAPDGSFRWVSPDGAFVTGQAGAR